MNYWHDGHSNVDLVWASNFEVIKDRKITDL